MGLRAWVFWISGSGFRVWALGFRVWGLGSGAWSLGFRFKVWSLGFRAVISKGKGVPSKKARRGSTCLNLELQVPNPATLNPRTDTLNPRP